jgi:hypothetical protein
LLAAAPLFNDRVQQVQHQMALSIEADARDWKFRERFSEDRTLRERPAENPLGFQMHQGKLAYPLREVLAKHRLAWVPNKLEIFDVNAQYVSMHPTLGEAIMSTLAVACALTEGAHIVGDKRSGPLHEHLQSLRVDDVYNGVIHGGPAESVERATAHQLFEVVIGLACDTSKIGPQELAKLGEDRKAIRALLSELSTRASSIGAMYSGDKRDKAFQDHAASILAEWRSDAANMSNYCRRLLGLTLLDPGKDAMSALLEGAFTMANSSTAGGITGLLTAPLGPVVQFGSGIAVGLIAHGIKTYVEMHSNAGKGVYRYLTAMEKAGVVFRSEIKLKQQCVDGAAEAIPTTRH